MIISDIIETVKRGRPSKYTPETVERLLAALIAGQTQLQACKAIGICENTLAAWRRTNPELNPQMEGAREKMRQKVLENIRTAGENGDWRASVRFLKLSFPEYRQRKNGNLTATANAQQGMVVVTQEKRAELVAKLKAIQDQT
jgi:hypothetical protein